MKCAYPLFHSKGLCGCPLENGRPQRPSKATKTPAAGTGARAAQIKRGAPILRSTTPIKRTRVKPKPRDLDAEAAWHELRMATKDRRNGWCAIRWDDGCLDRGSHAHHLRPRGRGGTDEIENTEWTCSWCHSQVHANPEEARKRGWLR